MSATATASLSPLHIPRLQPTTVPPGPSGPSRPSLRVLEGGRAPGRLAEQATYRRRRLAAVVLVLALVVALVLLATAAAARLAGGSPSPAGGTSPTSAVASSAAGVEGVSAARSVVVQPGDTLWSIAAEIAPDADVRITVDQLIELNGSSPVVAGQELVLPTSTRPRPRRSGSARRPEAPAEGGRSEATPGAGTNASTGSVRSVRCPACGSFDDKVVDSRQSDDGASIRRRRACIDCGRRFTTFERVEETPLVVVKRSGDREPFDREKVATGIRLAAKGRPIEADGGEALDELINAVEDAMRLEGGEVPSEAVGRSVLERLREADPVAAVRFASVYLGFDDLSDFEREIKALAKRTEPKRH